jgi:hypothetical protein
MSMSSVSNIAREEDELQDQDDNNSVSSPSVRFKFVPQTNSALTKKGTNPQTSKSPNSTVSKKTGTTKMNAHS